jgi:CTP synthase
VNPDFLPRFEAAGLSIAGVGADTGKARAIEIREHPFYVATLFHPQLESKPGAPSPLVTAFIQAAISR